MSNPWNLTRAECRILCSLVNHGSNRDMAAALGLEEKTVEVHMQRAREKMGARNRVIQALMWDKHLRETQGDVFEPPARLTVVAPIPAPRINSVFALGAV